MSIPYNFNPLGFDLEKMYVLPIKNGYGVHDHINNPSFGVLVVENIPTYLGRPSWHMFNVLPKDFPMEYNSSYSSGGRSWTLWYDTTSWQVLNTCNIDLLFEKPIKIKSINYYVGVGSWGWYNYTLEIYGSNNGIYDNTPIATYTSSYNGPSTVKLFPIELIIELSLYFSNYRFKITAGPNRACGLVQLKLNAVFK